MYAADDRGALVLPRRPWCQSQLHQSIAPPEECSRYVYPKRTLHATLCIVYICVWYIFSQTCECRRLLCRALNGLCTAAYFMLVVRNRDKAVWAFANVTPYSPPVSSCRARKPSGTRLHGQYVHAGTISFGYVYFRCRWKVQTAIGN